MHECPDCYRACSCGGDIDDIDFGPFNGCACDCWMDEDVDDDFYDDRDDYYDAGFDPDGPSWNGK